MSFLGLGERCRLGWLLCFCCRCCPCFRFECLRLSRTEGPVRLLARFAFGLELKETMFKCQACM